jgi:hypothetical protein
MTTLVRAADNSPIGSRPLLAPSDEDTPNEPLPSRRTTRPDLQRCAVRSGTIGFFLTLLVVTAVVAANGGGLAAVAAGIMVAGFDGFPFGAMLGVMIYYMKYPEDS